MLSRRAHCRGELINHFKPLNRAVLLPLSSISAIERHSPRQTLFQCPFIYHPKSNCMFLLNNRSLPKSSLDVSSCRVQCALRNDSERKYNLYLRRYSKLELLSVSCADMLEHGVICFDFGNTYSCQGSSRACYKYFSCKKDNCCPLIILCQVRCCGVFAEDVGSSHTV